MKEAIGLIGIGLVGIALAENLLKNDYDVIGFDLKKERMQILEKIGGKVVDNVKQVACKTNRLFLSLFDTDTVLKVIKGNEGILDAEPLPKYIIDTTTGDPNKTSLLAENLKQYGIKYLDATISGSSDQIRQLESIYMVGGDENAYNICSDLLNVTGKNHFFLGPSGSGSKAKLASNIILGLNRLVLAEGLVFAEKFNLNLEKFLNILKASPAYSCAMDVKGNKMIKNDFKPQSRIRQHFKDLNIILHYAKMLNQDLPLTKIHFQILKRLMEQGKGDLDTSTVIEILRHSTKLK